LLILRRQAGQVEEVPRSSTKVDGEPGQGGLVDEDGDEPAELPLPQAQVVPASRRMGQHTPGVTGSSAVTSSHSRPPSASRVTERTCSAG
jgi:hypothetical protein